MPQEASPKVASALLRLLPPLPGPRKGSEVTGPKRIQRALHLCCACAVVCCCFMAKRPLPCLAPVLPALVASLGAMGNCNCPVVVRQPRDKFTKLDNLQECDGDQNIEGPLHGKEDFVNEVAAANYSGNKGVHVWPPRSSSGDSDVESETEEPKQIQRPRRGAVFAEQMQSTGYYKEPYWNKHVAWENQLFVALSACPIFQQFTDVEITKFVRAMEIHLRYAGEPLCQEGEAGDGLFVVLMGTISCYKGSQLCTIKPPGSLIDEAAVLYSYPRPYFMKAQGECVMAKLCRKDYVDLGTRFQFYAREKYKSLLMETKVLETMPPEGIARIADTLQKRTYQPKEDIIRQHEEGKEFFIMLSGVARVWVRTGNDEQEYKRYKAGDLFGELALLKNAPRAAFVSAVTSVEVLALTRKQFERLFGPMTDLQQQQYLTDPRKLIADFYMTGDARGPRGSLKLHQLTPDAKAHGESTWFAVYRPTSKDAIAKMLSGVAVGKGLNVKGKSAKKGVLSGFVPFIQISDNDHRSIIEQSPRESRVTVYYKTKASRQEAQKLLQAALEDTSLDIEDRSIRLVDDFQPESWGLDLPEPLIREMYIVRSDLTPVMGWETGRRSEPAFMDMNLHAIRGKSEPQVVLYQYDESDPMNPRGLLIAYAEAHVKPVVSDFDTFTVGSRGMRYSQLPADQAQLITWLLQRTQEILGSLDHNPWTSRWLEVLKKENEKEDGVHPELPKFGFGDPTSYQLIADVVAETAPCGAVRHGAECCNFYFPQELDDEFLVVWHGFNEMHGKPWDYKDESSLRAFLLERIKEGYSFPLNPVWPVRDKGWFEVFQALNASEHGAADLQSWFPPELDYSNTIERLHAKFPEGFRLVQKCRPPSLAALATSARNT
ncbi:unnamed protein product [Symbiodinium sp. KB8]|nr:unnamed protein product [Symbiodinium sp. KB8]